MNRAIIILLMSTLLLSACQTTGSRNRSAPGAIDAAMEQGAKDAAGGVPDSVSRALIPELNIQLPKGKQMTMENRFNLSVNRVSARQVFLGLVEGTKYSVAIAPEVSGAITLSLSNVTVPEAMNVIRRVYGYGFYQEDNRFYISGKGIQTRLFPVNYLTIKRDGLSSTFVSAGGIANTSSGQNSNSDTVDSSGNRSSNNAAPQSQATIQVDSETRSDFWADLQTTLETIIGKKKGHRVIVNPQANLAIVRASPRELRVVEDFLGVTAQTVSRQVVLEAKIIEVELSDQFQAGVNWSYLASTNTKDFTISQTGGGSVFGGGGVGLAGTSLGTLSPSGGTFTGDTGTIASAFGGVFSLAVEGNNFNAFVEALELQGEVQVLSSPRVSTVNNQKAVIKVGVDEFFVTDITVETGSVGAAQQGFEFSPFFSGIALDVTPQISANKEIILHIHPTISEVTEKNKPTPGGAQIPFARSSVQESDNVVKAKSGQVIVIAGLMKEAMTEDNASVPFLGSIPIIGNLFKHKRFVRVKKELVILLKPTVVDHGSIWADMVNNSKAQIERTRQGF